MREYKATRHDLRAVRERLAFAERAHEMLETKRDALVLEFMDVLDEAEGMYDDLDAAYDLAQSDLDRVRALKGDVALETLAWARHAHPAVSVVEKNVMGVVVPHLDAIDVRVDVDKLGYGLLGTSPAIDEVILAYEDLLESVVHVAELESTLRRLLAEIERTVRRVNALEHALLPELRRNERRIRRHLDEREREAIALRKWVKDTKHEGIREKAAAVRSDEHGEGHRGGERATDEHGEGHRGGDGPGGGAGDDGYRDGEGATGRGSSASGTS